MSLDNVEKLMWKYLIDAGGIIKDESFYGTIIDIEKTIEVRDIVKTQGIDWDQTKGVTDDWAEKFDGTFDEPARIEFLKGTLYTNDGGKWTWYLQYDEPFDILQLVKDFIPDPFEVL